MRIDHSTPAIVTGGASGLGAAVSRALAARGAPVTVLDRDADRGGDLAEELGAGFVAVDVADDASVDAGLAAARRRQGQERICVNCAGVVSAGRTAGPRGAHGSAAFERVIAVNLIGTFRVMARSAAGMVGAAPLPGADAERGVIVNTASVAAFDGQIGQVAYAASKGGVAAMTLPAARDLASSGIRVIAIAPGVFATPMLADVSEEIRASLAQQVPGPRRLGDPAEFAALVCAAVENSYLNGETIRIDGALRMGPR